ncbi:MAG: ribonuclease P protein component [Thermoanaerobaculia bacterium]
MSDRPVRPARSESLSRDERLRHRREFLTCYRRGRRRHGSLLILYAHPNALHHPRLGITASRKVGGAVLRHRLKRRIREVYRRWSGRTSLPAMDLVVHVKPAARESEYATLRQDLERLLCSLTSVRADR